MKLAKNVFPSKVWVPFVFGAIGILLAWVLSIALPDYFVFLAITVVIATITLLGLGVVTGTAGMIVLSQLAFAAVGAFTVTFLNVNQFPGGYLLWIIIGAIVAGVVGILLGLPALRLRGVNLAVVTLGFGAALDSMLQKTQFPGSQQGIKVPRPEAFLSDREFFVLAAIVLVVVAIILFFLQNSRVGSSWRSVAFSERGTAAAGSSVIYAKLTAFAVSAAIAGLSGGLIAGQVGAPYAASFSTLQSLALYVLSIVAGSHLLEMAIFGGILWVLIPELLKRFGVAQDWGFVIFGIMGVQALTTNSTIGQDIRNAISRRQHRRNQVEEAKLVPFTDAQKAEYGDGQVELGESRLSVEDLVVTFGQVKALRGVTLDVKAGEVVGLIGPNGAGKSTLVDAVSGFLPNHEGVVRLGDTELGNMPPHRRAQLGLRRTFQQDRVPPLLTVGDYVEFVARGASTRNEIRETLEFFGCPAPRTRINNVDVGTRRIIEVAANLLAKPKMLILDEPAAGLSHEEHIAFGDRLRLVPERFGASVLIIEHDLDLVRRCCTRVVALNFGEVLAIGTVEEVLTNPEVTKAYMGETEIL